MQQFLIGLFIALFTLVSGYSLSARAESNPGLTAIDNDNDRSIRKGILSFTSLDVKVDVVGGVTQTYIQAVIYNSSDEEVEGEFKLHMPEGSIINDYALDIEGHLVSGVLTEKERAEKAYTDRVTRNVDPGIAEVERGNIYKTRIFPIPSEESRTIAIGFATPVMEQDYALKLKTDTDISVATLTVPYSKRSLRDNPALEQEGIGRYSQKKARLDVQIDIPARHSRPVLTRHPSGQGFFSFGLTGEEAAKLSGTENVQACKLRIYWDHSLSRSDDDLAAERGILRSFIQKADPQQIEVITGNGYITSRQIFTGEDAVALVDGRLSALDYDGGSDLSALLSASEGSADMCILFSDGHATIGSYAVPKPDCPIYSISSAKDANRAMLGLLAEQSGGYVITDISSRKKSVKLLQQAPRGLIQQSNALDIKRLGQGQSVIFVVPLASSLPDVIKLEIAGLGGNPVLIERDLRGYEFIDHAGVGTLWATRKAEELRTLGNVSYSDIIAFSRPYNLAGPESALIVLEDTSDYVEAGITPPKNFPADLMEDYTAELADREMEQAENKADRLDDIIELWEEQIEWWEEDYSKEKRKNTHSGNSTPPPPPPPAMVIANSPVAESDRLGDTSSYGGSGSTEILVTGSRIRQTIDIEIRKWSPDRAYLKALKAAQGQDFETVYRRQRSSYGDLPAFYLEVADLLHQNDNDIRAAQVVMGALELPSANVDTQTLVAHRLLTYGEYDRAIGLYEKALNASVNRPQPYYNLAVALIDRAQAKGDEADVMAALQHLDYIIRNVWDGDDDGIEIVALLEANAALARLPGRVRKNVSIDKALIKNLDVDLRIVMGWNVDDADIDLWVTEPGGEKASYNNQLTKSGGQVSNDMTDGYGPEQYLLRRAQSGTYVIRSDLYSSDAYNPNGAIGVRARIIKDFGRPEALTRTIIIELSEKGDDDFIVGEYVVD